MNHHNKSKIGIIIAYLYILIPFVIFVLGWFQLYFSIPLTLIFIVSTLFMIRDTDSLWIPTFNTENIGKIIFILAAILLVIYLSGIGGYSYQNGDHFSRNTIFRILVEYDWPVIAKQPDGSSRVMSYYIGFWMPAAIIGKIAGINAGFFFQYLWAAFGLAVVAYLICAWRQKIDLIALLIMIFFSGLDAIGYYLELFWQFIIQHKPIPDNIMGLLFTAHMEWWAHDFQFSSHITQLFHVFNQALPVWIIIMLMLFQTNVKNLVFLLGLSLLTSTLPFFGLIPIFLVLVFGVRKSDSILDYSFLKLSNFANRIKHTLTFQNILGGGCSGIFTFLYLKDNAARTPSEVAQAVTSKAPAIPIRTIPVPSAPVISPPSVEKILLAFVLFLLLEVGVYAIVLYQANKTNLLFWTNICFLMLVPLIKVGRGADFSMRASIPGLMIIMLLLIEKFTTTQSQNMKVVLCLLLLIASITPLHEIGRSVINTIPALDQTDEVITSDISEDLIFSPGNNFTSKRSNTFFYQYILKNDCE